MYILSKRDSEAERYIMKLEEAKMHKINRVMFYFEKGDFSFLPFIYLPVLQPIVYLVCRVTGVEHTY